MSWRRSRPAEGLHPLSPEELLNRVIKAKALLALCGSMTVTLRTAEGNFEITPELAKELLSESKSRKIRWESQPRPFRMKPEGIGTMDGGSRIQESR